MDVIAGDIGGTKSWLVWAEVDGSGGVNVRFEHVYASAGFASAADLLHQFYADAQLAKPPAGVCLALPGPVREGMPIRLTNLDWTLERAALQTALGTPRLLFLNDFQAAARGVATLAVEDYVTLNTGEETAGQVRVITGAGTGLGLAWMQADASGRYQTFATEGGHTDFAPANAQQEHLLAFMRQSFSHVSWERVLSGLGMNPIYQFCLQTLTGDIPPALRDHNGAVVNALAQAGDPVAVAAMELFTDLYANWVGNITLLYQPRGGLYLAGGISARIQPWLQAQRFLDACFDKGRMSALVRQMPIHLITNTRLGLQGALAAAMDTTH
jgi:glucokinase